MSFDTPQLADKMALSVQAPAGFGKTLLLAQWRREWLSRGAIVAWLTLDERDSCMRFVQGLAAAMALGSGRPGFASAIERMLGNSLDELEALTGWLADVVDLGGEAVLILDEVHLLPESTISHTLTYLLHNAPANLRIIMASRGRLNLPVAELIAHGQYAALTQDRLNFSADESMAMLLARFGNRIDADMCLQLHELTEGWPLGLQLVVAALEKHADLAQAIRGLSSSSGDVQRYFVDCLVERLPPRQMDFLVRIAFLDMIHPQLAESLSVEGSGRELLQQLCASTPIFVEGVDSEWVRIHPLAREFLQQRFAALPEAERRALHEQAAGWLAEHGLLEEGARHALLAGQAELAYQLAEDSLFEITVRGHFGRVLEWFDRLPRAVVEARPKLQLAVAWALAMGERHREVAAFIEPLRSAAAPGSARRCEADAIVAAAAYFGDRLDEAYEVLLPWFRQPPQQPRQQALLAGKQARLLLFRGEPEQARLAWQRAPAYEGCERYDAIRGFGDWAVGLSYLWEGRLALAEESLRRSLTLAEQEIGRRSPPAVTLAAGLAITLLGRGAVQEATSVLANRMDIIERVATPEAIVLGYHCAARLAVLGGQLQRAYDLLGALYALGESRGILRFCVSSLGEQIRLHACREQADTCQMLWRRLEERIPQFGEGVYGPALQMIMQVARAYVALASADWPAMQDALGQASALAERLRRGRELVQIKLLQALALRRQGLGGQRELQEGLSLARDYGMVQVLADSHPELLEWARTLDGVAAAVGEPLPVAANDSLPGSPRELPTSVSPSRLLTPKEREVLLLLARSLSNKQIALALNVGEETVKWHIKNLFGKFQAGTRKHVVDRAYMLGIIEGGF